MKLIYTGKTKNVFDNLDGTYTLKLKDDATGKDGVFDPGMNQVGLTIEGLGRESLRLSEYYFRKLSAAGVPTHFVDCDFEEVTMKILPAELFGKGLEFVCRRLSWGSFVRRYGQYTTQGENLDYLVEVTLKSDEREDPPIAPESLVALGIMTDAEYAECHRLTREVARLIHEDLTSHGLELADIKFEFGKCDGKITLVDEFSAGVMRALRDGEVVAPMELAGLVLGE
ncbi:MAG: phosphoribosylaminoimidazolesuccinocarboxamide synthase [Oscillospiraceae bacterium]|nr:phosphoribosylaminoimidazolesuccinocarboxamide synthase [Oscillospiraceae bacterium]